MSRHYTANTPNDIAELMREHGITAPWINAEINRHPVQIPLPAYEHGPIEWKENPDHTVS